MASPGMAPNNAELFEQLRDEHREQIKEIHDQHERHIERIVVAFKELRDDQQKLFALLSRRETAHEKLATRVDRLDEDLRGRNGEGGLVAEVENHTAHINKMYGVAAVLSLLGGGIIWIMDHTFFKTAGH